jgi:hypothetical protein
MFTHSPSVATRFDADFRLTPYAYNELRRGYLLGNRLIATDQASIPGALREDTSGMVPSRLPMSGYDGQARYFKPTEMLTTP